MDNVTRENDILVSSLLNPEANIKDLVFNGIKASNTQFLTPDQYKESDFIKSKFTDDLGKFHDDLFDKLYQLAANKYLQLADLETFDEWNKLNVWNPNSIYAPIDSKKLAENPTISRIRNPFEQTTGLRALYKTQESEKSIRELALKNKIFDTKTGKYLDKSAEDLGLFGGLFSTPLVYATWDEDGEHFDESIGRTVKHKKGEFKLNEDGKFYTETIGDRLGYGKQYVALSDILTKEDSWLNKIDFFDSDDKDKSIGGTIAKTLFKISPYFIPGFNKIYGGITALWALSEIMPTFAKAIEGIFIGDRETGFTKKMNLLENYAGKFKPSYSDEAQGKLFGIEQFGSMVADIFGQLYQMKWMSELSRFSKLGTSFGNLAAFENFISKHGAEFDNLVKLGKIKPTKDGILDFWKSIVGQTPEMLAALKSQQELAKRLSLGYMAFLLSADVYSEAIQGGFDKRMAGAAALAAMAGQYGIMMNNELGTWFLRATTGYAENENRWLMRKTIKPLFELFQTDLAALPREATTQEKLAFLGKVFNKTNKALLNLWDGIKNGSEQFWTRSTIEAVEEVTEEAVMDMTKGVFDILSWAGIGKNSDTATFNTIENTFSKEGFTRYAQNALGGFIGGSLFQFLENYVEPWITGKKIDRNTLSDMIQLIQTGHAEDLKKAALSLGETDNNVLASEIPFGDNSILLSTQNGQTRGLLAASKVINHINWIQGLLDDYNLNLSGDDLFRKAVRDQQILPIIKDSGISEILNSDFHQAVTDIVTLQSEIETLQAKENRTEDEETKLKEFVSERKEKTEWINKFLNGELYEPYLKMALIYTNSNIRDNLSNVSLYQFTQSKYNKKFSELPATGVGTTQESVRKEYEEFKNTTDKKEHLQTLSAVFDNLELIFSTPIFEYSNSKYGDVRRKSFEKVISAFNLNLDKSIQDTNYYNLLLAISNELIKLGQKAVSLQDIVLAEDSQILDLLDPILDLDPRLVNSISELLGMTSLEYKQWFSNLIYLTIGSMPIENWNVQAFNQVIVAATNTVSNEIIKKLSEVNPELTKQDIDLFLINSGITPSDLEVTNLQNYLTYKIGRLLNPDTNIVENLALNTLSNYIQQENILDDEVVRFIKKSAKQSINRRFLNTLSRSLSSIGWEDPEIGDVSFILTAQDLVNIKLTIEQGIDLGDSIDEIVENILNDPVTGLITVHSNEAEFPEETKMFRENPDFINQAENIIKDHLAGLNLYNKTVGKNLVNPLYDILRKVLFELTDNVSDTIFDLIERESINLQDLSSIEEYIKMPDVINQIDSAISVLHTVKAILAGMEDGEVNFSDRLFGFNTQIRKYLEKYQEGKNADKYQVISTEDITTIGKDLDLIESKLNFIKALSSKNTDSKVAEDNNSRINFLNLVAKELINNASKLNIKGVSIFTNDDLAKLLDESTDISIRLGIVEHNMFEKFNEILKTTDVKEAVTILLDNLGLNKEAITRSSLESYGINPRVTAISPYDIFVYLATVLGHDLNDYNFRYKQYLQSEDSNKVPLFGQEYGVKVAYSFLLDNLKIHQEFANYLLKDQEYPAKASNIYFADGVSGSGKTTAIAKTLLNMSNINNIIVSAPNSNLANKLKDSLAIDSVSLSKQELLSMFLKDEVNLTDKEHLEQVSINIGDNNVGYYRLKNVEDASLYKENILNIPNLIFIDEATHFNTAELLALDYMANKYNFKVIALGDTFLESATINEIENHIDSIFTWKSARLNISIRPSNENKKENIDRLSTMIDSYYEKLRSSHNLNEAIQNLRSNLSKGLILKYYEDNTSIKGDKIVDSITSNDLNKLKESSDGPIGIIANLTGTENSIDNISDPNLQAAIKGSNLTPNDYVIYSPDKINNFAVQGAEAKYFVVNDINIDSSTPIEESIVRLYTQATRSQEGSIIKLSDLAKIALNISNLKTTEPNMYRLPGLNLLSELKSRRVEIINNIIDNWIPSTSETTSKASVVEPVVESEDQNLIEDSVSRNPDITVENVESEDTDLRATEGLNLLTYPFYHHTGLNQFNLDEVTVANSGLNLDLYGILPAGTIISQDAILGFIKLQNLVSLSDNLSEIKSGLRNSKFIKEILQLVKELAPQVELLGDDYIVSELIKSVNVGNTLIVGVSMNSQTDLPYLDSFSDLVEEGSPLLMTAKNVSFKIGDYSFDRLISTSVLAKSSTAAKANNKALYDSIINLEDKARLDLKNQKMVIYPVSIEPSSYDTREGRLIHIPNSYTSLSKLVGEGVNIKKVGLITRAKNSAGLYKFIEFAKKYNPQIEQIALKNDEFQLAGKYFIIASYSNINNGKENLIICDLNQISFNDAILKIKDSPKKLLELNKILHVASLQKLVLEMLGKMGAFDIENTSVTTNGLLSEILEVFKKNPSVHAQRILALDEALNRGSVLTREDVQNLLKDPRMKSFGVMFADHFTIVDSAGNIKTRFGNLNLEGYGYSNIAPISKPNDDGWCEVDDFNLNDLGIRNYQYLIRRMALPIQSILGSSTITEETIPELEIVTEPLVQTNLEENSQEIKEMLTNDILDFLAVDSEDDLSDIILDRFNFLVSYGKNIDGYNLVKHIDEDLNLDDAYLNYLGEDFKQMWDLINNKETEC